MHTTPPFPVPPAEAAAPDPTADPAAAEQLFAQLYAELHQLAHRRLQQSADITGLNTTDLLHGSFLRLRQAAPAAFPDERHFMAYAARAMRSVVVDLVRSRQARRHGGDLERIVLDTDLLGRLAPAGSHDEEVLRVNEALADLARLEPRLATVVELRYFAGLTEAEMAAILGVNLRTVQRDWAKARLFLSMALR